MFDNEILSEIEKKIVVTEEPFPNAIIEKFLPLEIVKKLYCPNFLIYCPNSRLSDSLLTKF